MTVSFGEVLEVFGRDHDLEQGSNDYAADCLALANFQFDGHWQKKRLSEDEVLGIVLPHHKHPGTAPTLIPATGLTVKAAIKRFKTARDYKQTNPYCWKSIMMLKKDTGPIFVSREPIENNDFMTLKTFKGNHLYHIDGLHRLIARNLVDGYSDDYLQKHPVLAYVAG